MATSPVVQAMTGQPVSPVNPRAGRVTAVPPPVTPATPPQDSARAIINDALAQYGLSGLATQAWQQYLTGMPVEQIGLWLRTTPEYAARFPGMAALRKAGQALSEAEYVAKERADAEMLRAYGLPAAFYNDRNLLGNLIGNQVSTAELQGRLDAYRAVVTDGSMSGVRAYARDAFGLGDGDLIAYFIDPDRAAPVLEQQARASQIGAAAARAGWTGLDPATALQLAGRGVSPQQAEQGFGQAATLRLLTQNLPGQQGGQVAEQDVTAAVLNQDAQAKRRVQQAVEERVNPFRAGGRFTEDTRGVTGLGQAATF